MKVEVDEKDDFIHQFDILFATMFIVVRLISRLIDVSTQPIQASILGPTLGPFCSYRPTFLMRKPAPVSTIGKEEATGPCHSDYDVLRECINVETISQLAFL